jgi:hypothetical protein
VPAAGQPPGLREFLSAYGDGLVGHSDLVALDRHDGAAFEIPGGASALLWSRQAQRDRALFHACYTTTATGGDLDRHVEAKYGGIERIRETLGQGSAVVARPTAAGGAGTLYAGTRIGVRIGPRRAVYAVAEDTPVAADVLGLRVAVEATVPGSGTSIDARGGIAFDDPIFDATFAIQSIACAEGTDEETSAAYISRARAAKQASRVGYRDRILKACQDAGAAEVVLLSATDFGAANDFGLSYVYVGDSAFSTSAALKKACFLALDPIRVGGCDLQVLGMQRQALTVSATVRFWDDPSRFNVAQIGTKIIRSIADQFGGDSSWWLFSLAGLEGLAQAQSPDIQSVAVTTDPAVPSVAFPSVLTRYTLGRAAIRLSFLGPA